MNVLILTYWSFREGLIQTYTLPYLGQISKNIGQQNCIFLVTLEKTHLGYSKSEAEEVNRRLAEDKIVWIPLRYMKPGPVLVLYFAMAILRLSFTILSKKVHYIHAFCTPAGGLGYLLSLITGKKLVIDSMEPHAESMVENGTWSRRSTRYKVLSWFEKRQILHASFIIGTTSKIPEYIYKRFGIVIDRGRFCVKPACVNLQLFKSPTIDEKLKIRGELGLGSNDVVAVYAGKLGGIYLEKETFALLKEADNYWYGRFKFLMLTDTSRSIIEQLAKEVGIDPNRIVSKFSDHQEVPRFLSAGDFGITPVKSVPTKRYCTPIKDGEYWALGLPIIITPNISDDSDIVRKEKIGSVVQGLDEDAYRRSIEEIDELLSGDRIKLAEKIRMIAQTHRSFEIARNCYEKIYLNEG